MAATTTYLTYWNQIVPVYSVDNIEQHLSARVRDPLWMLSRQWQFGEFQGEDAGSPAFASVQAITSPIATWRTGPTDPTAKRVPADAPFEKALEDEFPDLAAPGPRVEIAEMLEVCLEDAGVGLDVIKRLRAAYPMTNDGHLTLPDGTKIQTVDSRDSETLRFLRICSGGRVIDYFSMTIDLKYAADHAIPPKTPYGPPYTDPPVIPDAWKTGTINLSPGDQAKVVTAIQRFVQWLITTFPFDKDGTGWTTERLEYSGEAFARTGYQATPPDPIWNDNAAAALQLGVHPDRDGTVDWFSFDWEATLSSTDMAAAAVGIGAGVGTQSSFNVKAFPGHVRFKGMPNERWWDFENNEVDFGSIEPERRDLGKLMLIDIALTHSNDWFLIPFEMDAGSLSLISYVRVQDVFGNKIELSRGGLRLFQSLMYHPSGYAIPSYLISPPSSVGAVQESEPIEEVHFLRDSQAEMAWGIEATTANGLGGPWSGYDRAAAAPPLYSPPATPAPAPAPRPGDVPLDYLLETSVPENWIPLMPIRVDPTQGIVKLQRSAMERLTTDSHGNLVVVDVPPLGRIIGSMSTGTNTAAAIAEAELPREGLRLSRIYNRSRWTDGSTRVWISRVRAPGRGEARSGLTYDQALYRKAT